MRGVIATVLLTLNRDGALADEERAFLKRQLDVVNTSAGIASAAKCPTMSAVVIPRDEYDALVRIRRRVAAEEGGELCAACDRQIGDLEPRVSVWLGAGEDPVRGAVHMECAQDITEIELNARRENV